MLAHRLRRWSNIKTTLGQCLMFAGVFSQLMSSQLSTGSYLLMGRGVVG